MYDSGKNLETNRKYGDRTKDGDVISQVAASDINLDA
jgi:hypothetical protein